MKPTRFTALALMLVVLLTSNLLAQNPAKGGTLQPIAANPYLEADRAITELKIAAISTSINDIFSFHEVPDTLHDTLSVYLALVDTSLFQQGFQFTIPRISKGFVVLSYLSIHSPTNSKHTLLTALGTNYTVYLDVQKHPVDPRYVVWDYAHITQPDGIAMQHHPLLNNTNSK